MMMPEHRSHRHHHITRLQVTCHRVHHFDLFDVVDIDWHLEGRFHMVSNLVPGKKYALSVSGVKADGSSEPLPSGAVYTWAVKDAANIVLDNATAASPTFTLGAAATGSEEFDVSVLMPDGRTLTSTLSLPVQTVPGSDIVSLAIDVNEVAA